MKAKQLLTSSRQSAFLTCQRKHYWRYERALVHDTERTELAFGTAWHNAMECRWKGGDFDAALAAALPNGVQLDEYQCATISALLAGYYRYWQNDPVDKCHPEVEFGPHPITGIRSFASAGKIDGLCVMKDDSLALLEIKTTKDDVSPASDYWMRLRYNPQLYQYVIAARRLGWNVAKVFYDVLRKPGISPCQVAVVDEFGAKIVQDSEGNRIYNRDGVPRQSADTKQGWKVKTRTETPGEFLIRLGEDVAQRPEFYFARREVPVLDQDLEDFEQQRVTIARGILSARRNERRFDLPERAWPRNVSNMTCSWCEYAGFCLNNISVKPDQPPAGYKVGETNTELTQKA